MSEARTWMPLFVADYLADTRHLSTAEHGAYLLLIMHAWVSDGRLPLDEKRLARIAGMDAEEWRESREVILEFFTRHEDGYRHKRIDAELERATANIEQRRAAGRASAAARARQRNGSGRSNARSTDVATDDPTSVATDVPTEGQRKRRPPPPPSPTVTESADAASVTSARPQQPQQSAPMKIPIPEDWQPSEADLSFVEQNTLAAPWSAEKTRRVIHEFVNHYRSRGQLSADWSADFRRWVLRQPRFEQHDATPSPAGFHDPILRAIEDELGAE